MTKRFRTLAQTLGLTLNADGSASAIIVPANAELIALPTASDGLMTDVLYRGEPICLPTRSLEVLADEPEFVG